MRKTRLQQLHDAYEESLNKKETDWVFTYNEAPPTDRYVQTWLKYYNEDGSSYDVFGVVLHYGICFDYGSSHIVAWKDI